MAIVNGSSSDTDSDDSFDKAKAQLKTPLLRRSILLHDRRPQEGVQTLPRLPPWPYVTHIVPTTCQNISFAKDPQGRFKNKFGEFILKLRDTLHNSVTINSLLQTADGSKIRSHFRQSVNEAITELGLLIHEGDSFTECVVRGVPMHASEDSILEDLLSHLHPVSVR